MQEEDRISVIHRVKTFMSIENADPSLVLLGLVPQKLLKINSFFGVSVDGNSYGVRMHPLFPIRLLEFFPPQCVQSEKGMVSPEAWPLVHEIFTQLCDESFTLESWFPCPAPLRVYGEDIRCFKVIAISKRRFDPSIRPLTKNLLERNDVRMEDVLRNIECQRLGWQGNRASTLAELVGLFLSHEQELGLQGSEIYVRVIVRGSCIRVYSSLLMTEHHADNLRASFQRWMKASNHKEHKSMFILEEDGSPVDAPMDEPVYVFDFVHTGGAPAPRQIKSFAYDSEDMKDSEKVDEMPVKPSDFLKYLRFAQFEGADCNPPAMEKESVCGVKKRSKTGIQTDKENVSIQQV